MPKHPADSTLGDHFVAEAERDILSFFIRELHIKLTEYRRKTGTVREVTIDTQGAHVTLDRADMRRLRAILRMLAKEMGE